MSRYIRYMIENVSPLRISDNSTSQSGQTFSLKHIPGTTMRGYVISRLAQRDTFEVKEKKLLFSDKVRFLNAYMHVSDKDLIPSPKGFYEDKNPDNYEVQNVTIDGELNDGYKRASLGRYCYLENGCIHYYNVETEADMRIRIGTSKEQNIFRNECIQPGYCFAGYIAVEDDELADEIREILTGYIYLGNGRSQGLGKCKVLNSEWIDQIPYSAYAAQTDMEQECYLMLLSHGTMLDERGIFCGLNLHTLEEQLGVKDLSIEYASTSIVQIHGYNRVYRSKTPSVPMYEQGSVFHLSYTGCIRKENLLRLMDQGIGVRRNEGFGRILFLKEYEQITRKEPGQMTQSAVDTPLKKMPEDERTLRKIAGNYYRLLLQQKIQEQIRKGTNAQGINRSQVGQVLAVLEQNKYNAAEGKQIIEQYFANALKKDDKKNKHDNKNSIRPFEQVISDVLNQPIQDTLHWHDIKEVMGVPVTELLTEQDAYGIKVRYLIDLIRYENKGKGEK